MISWRVCRRKQLLSLGKKQKILTVTVRPNTMIIATSITVTALRDNRSHWQVDATEVEDAREEESESDQNSDDEPISKKQRQTVLDA